RTTSASDGRSSRLTRSMRFRAVELERLRRRTRVIASVSMRLLPSSPTRSSADCAELFRGDRKRHAVDQENSVDIGTALVLVGGSDLIAVLRDEIVVIGDEQKEVLRIGAIQRRDDCHAFPLFG